MKRFLPLLVLSGCATYHPPPEKKVVTHLYKCNIWVYGQGVVSSINAYATDINAATKVGIVVMQRIQETSNIRSASVTCERIDDL